MDIKDSKPKYDCDTEEENVHISDIKYKLKLFLSRNYGKGPKKSLYIWPAHSICVQRLDHSFRFLFQKKSRHQRIKVMLGNLTKITKTNLTKVSETSNLGKGSSYPEMKMLTTPQGPQIWVPTVSHLIYVLANMWKTRSTLLLIK